MRPFLVELRRQHGLRRQRLGWALLWVGTSLLLLSCAFLVHGRLAIGALNKELALADAALAKASAASGAEMSSLASPVRIKLQESRPWLEAPWERAFVALETVQPQRGHLQAAEMNAATGQMHLTLVVADVADGIEYAIRLGQRGGLSDVRVISHETDAKALPGNAASAGAGSAALLDAPMEGHVTVQARWTRALGEAQPQRSTRAEGPEGLPTFQSGGGPR